MLHPRLPANESARLHALQRMDLLRAGRDERCQRYARLARALTDTPIAAVSVLDADTQWLRGCSGMDAECTPRAVSFCGHAIHEPVLFEVPDARADLRFVDNPIVRGEPFVRFYAGCPVRLPGDLAVGALCVIDHVPRMLTDAQRVHLRDLADCLQSELGTLLSVADMRDVAQELARLLPTGTPPARLPT